jgi:hypothetical protein
MFDELDDPAYGGSVADARAAVAARAARIRRRRRAAWAGSGTSIILVVAGIAYGVRASEPARRAAIVSESESPSESAEPSVTSATAEPTPSPEVITDPHSALYPGDGRPGWADGWVRCTQTKALPPPGTAPFPDMTLGLRIPATLASGKTHQAHLVFTNTGDRYLRFSYHQPAHGLMDGRGNASGQISNDAVPVYEVELAPGEVSEQPVAVNAWACGDTRDDPETPLPAGEYTYAVEFYWSGRTVGSAQPAPSGEATGASETATPTQEPTPTPAPSPRWGEPDNSGFRTWSVRATVTLTE